MVNWPTRSDSSDPAGGAVAWPLTPPPAAASAQAPSASINRPLRPRTAALAVAVRLLSEFVGHGAFGIITKAAWVPYFEVVGIPSAGPTG
jgi:hypothetical protein